jgi:hypothetical protein
MESRVYGGSAGTIVLGSDISTAAHMDVNEIGIADTRGFDLVHGHSIWCHYSDDQDRPHPIGGGSGRCAEHIPRNVAQL